MFKKNTAVVGFGIGHFINATTGAAVTTGTPTCKRTIDGTGGSCANAASYNSDGAVWEIDLAAGDMNGDVVILSFTLTDCLPISYTIKTVTAVPDANGYYPADAVAISGDTTAANNAELAFDGTGYAFTGCTIAVLGTSVRSALGMASNNMDTQLGNIPTVAEFEARTLAAADYATATLLGTAIDYIDTEVADIMAVTNRLDTALELDGAVYRFTSNALEQAPSVSGGDATAANQTTIITHLTDLKGTGFVKDTHSMPQCLTATGFPTLAQMTAAFTEIKGAGWSAATDTLEESRDAIDALSVSAANVDVTITGENVTISNE